MIRDGCIEADKLLGNGATCGECPFDQGHVDEKEWASEQARWPVRMLRMWYQGKDIAEIASAIGTSKSTVRRSLDEFRPEKWGNDWFEWWRGMLVKRNVEGRPIAELERILKLNKQQISAIIKEESGRSSQQSDNQAVLDEQSLPQGLLNTPEFERWHKLAWGRCGGSWTVTPGLWRRVEHLEPRQKMPGRWSLGK